MVKVKSGETLPHVAENKRSRSLNQGHRAAGNEDCQCLAHPQGERNYPFVHLFHKVLSLVRQRGNRGHAVLVRRWGGALGSGVSKEDWTISFTEDYQRGPWGHVTSQALSSPHTGGSTCSILLGGTAREIARRPSLPEERLHETSLAVLLSLRLGSRGWTKPEAGKLLDLRRRTEGRVGEGRNNLRSHFVLAPLPSSLPGLLLPQALLSGCTGSQEEQIAPSTAAIGPLRVYPPSFTGILPLPPASADRSRMRTRCRRSPFPPPALSDRGLPRAGSLGPALPFPPGRSESGGERESSRTLRSCVIARRGGVEAGPRRAFWFFISALRRTWPSIG